MELALVADLLVNDVDVPERKFTPAMLPSYPVPHPGPIPVDPVRCAECSNDCVVLCTVVYAVELCSAPKKKNKKQKQICAT